MEEKYYELTAPQKAIWLTEQYYKNTNVNNVCGTFYSAEKLDFDLLKKSLNIFLQNNDSFKIKLKEFDGEIRQYFSDNINIDFELVSIKNKEEQTALEEQVDSYVFSMLDSFLFKIVLFRYPDGHGGFVINSHHIISDSWTNGIIANDVALIYEKIKNNEDYSKDESLSYKTYLQSEIDYKNSNKFVKDKTYWNEIFNTVPEVATIPSIKETSNNQDSLDAKRLLLSLDDKILDKINNYCEENKVSLYNFFMTIFAIYLGRVSNLDEFVIGTPILNRTNFKEKQTTGMFINTLPLKINFKNENTFIDNLKDIAVSSMSLLRHQKYSFQYIIDDLRKKDSSLPKLYNVLYSYQITKMNGNEDSLNHTTSWTFNKTTTDDLDVHMFEWNENNSIQIAYDYKINKYAEQDIINIHSRILNIISQVLENTDILLKDIEIVTPKEKHKLLYEFNNTNVDYPKDKNIVDLFEEQVEKTPDNIAVIFKEQKLTYKELNEKANSLAKYLIGNKIRSESVVAIMLNRSLEMIVGIIATLKCGCSYLPIDISFPEDRIDYILNDSNVSTILTSKLTNKKIPKIYSTLDISFSNSLYKENKEFFNKKYLSSNIMYTIYTSGSTGNPKGVQISHKNFNNFLIGMNKNIDFSPNKTMLSITTISFDIFGLELWCSLTNGLKLVIASEEEQNNPNALNTLCNRYNVNIIQTTPSRFNSILLNSKDISCFRNFTDILVGGEPLSEKLLEKLRNIVSCNIYNMYGPTETTVWSTIKKLNNSDKISIGYPIANTKCYILDKNKNILPFFTPGELFIGGDGVSCGYLNKTDLNEKNFVNSPFNINEKIYNTGDLAYVNDNGELFHLGRIDYQIKIRGYRIELGEIENKALSFEGITNVVADSFDNKSIILYYTSSKNIDLNMFKNYLMNALPAYMLPSEYIKLKSFEYTPNGKIDRKKLPKTTKKNNYSNKPRNNVDSFLIETLSKLLDNTKINIEDSLFSIGGDSLLAINLSSIISKKYNINISTFDILKNQVLRDLSDIINKRINTNLTNTLSKIPNKEYYPISSAQKRIYYSCLKNKTSLLYNIAGGIILDNELDNKKLEDCFKQLIKRHSSLRTYFENKNDEIVQIIQEDIDFKLDFENENTNDVNSVYSNFVKPFNLSKAPLFRTKLVKLNNNKELLLLDMHHIISDGTSLNILMEDLCNLYNDKELSNKEIEYKDFAIWENKRLSNKELNKSKEFWGNQYTDDIPLLNMPSVYSRPNVQSFEGSNYFETIDTDTYNKVFSTAKNLNITPYMLMLSVYYITLSRYTSQDDIIVGTPIVGRELAELSNLIGMFVNSLPIRAKIDNTLTFKDFSSNVKDICTNSFMHGSYPFDMLVNDLKLKRDVSRNPLFDTMFIFQSGGLPSISFDGIKSKYFIPNNQISKFDLSLEITPIDNKFNLRFEYCTKLFDESFIKRFSTHYLNILNNILKNTEIKLSDINMLSKNEENQILYEFNNTKVDYPDKKTIIKLFEEQVENTPDKTAIVFENQKLTYKELNEKSNELARFLLANGTDVGDVVAILLDKSIEMIVSILGILKIGGTFLPIDVNYPNERIDYILKDSKTNILLTTSDLVHKANDTVQILYVEGNNSYFEQYDNNNLNINYDVSNVAYIMYTSGSTGNPKGVMVTNKNVVRLVKNTNYINFDKNENILQTGSIVFDACTFEIWGALLNGFKLFIMKKENLLDAFKLKEYLFTNNITTLWLTAPLFNQLSENDPYMFKNVKKLLTGGDVLSPKHINMVRRACPDLTIINGYGPTENTTFSCCFTIDKEYNTSIPIGKPISNSTAYVVSTFGNLCPIGVPGELWVGGDGVSKGYLNNKELTDKSFIPNPFDDGIIYKTGDLVKWLPNGNIEFIGRIDNQVKVRGFRIELNEINKRILENSFIKEAFTTIKTIDNNKYICSYIVPNKDLDINELKIYLSRYLPNYMIPTYFIKMKKLPINQNGKVDKNALPANFEKKVIIAEKEKPTNEEERILLDIYKKILNNEDIGISDDFFNLGGDSLTAMKVQIEAISHNINITYSDIFNYPTVKKLANSISSSKKHYKTSVKDFSKYDTLLKNNSLEKEIKCEQTPVGNILITGVTGFLGIHILDSFLKNEKGKAFCLIREKNGMNAKERIINDLHFYYGYKYDNLVNSRIIPVDGDFTRENFGLEDNYYNKLGGNISTIIHSAALVKHYGVYSEFEKANVIGTQNIVDFANKFNSKLIYISTISVSGNNLAEGSNIDNNFDEEKTFNETNFYIGQSLDNLYVRSKFEAEKAVLDGIENGLQACILRMGNLTSRFSEGKFQQNHFENAFVNRLKSFLQIGVFPKEALNLYCEFTPIDYCGDAIMKIASHFNKEYTVFHLLNEKHVYLDRLFKMLKEIGINIKLVTYSEFSDIIKEILNDPDKKQYISGIINDLTKDKKLVYKSDVKIESDFTKVFLSKIGFEWPYIDVEYIRKYFDYLKNIGYFDIKN